MANRFRPRRWRSRPGLIVETQPQLQPTLLRLIRECSATRGDIPVRAWPLSL